MEARQQATQPEPVPSGRCCPPSQAPADPQPPHRVLKGLITPPSQLVPPSPIRVGCPAPSLGRDTCIRIQLGQPTAGKGRKNSGSSGSHWPSQNLELLDLGLGRKRGKEEAFTHRHSFQKPWLCIMSSLNTQVQLGSENHIFFFASKGHVAELKESKQPTLPTPLAYNSTLTETQHLHPRDEGAEAQVGEVTCPGSQGIVIGGRD